jgi:hypothetical protein
MGAGLDDSPTEKLFGLIRPPELTHTVAERQTLDHSKQHKRGATLKTILTAALLLATLGAPAAALATDVSTAPTSQAQPAASVTMPTNQAASEKSTLLTRAAKDAVVSPWVPKYLTIQQQNDAAQREYEELFHVIHSP